MYQRELHDDRALERIVLPVLRGSRIQNNTPARNRGVVQSQAVSRSSLAINLRTSGNTSFKYPAKSHARRVAEKLKVKDGTIAIAASPSRLYPNSDQPVPFRQDRDFYYLTGSSEPGQYVTYDIGKDSLKLWLPEIDESEVVWTGRGDTVEEALEKYDIDAAEYLVPAVSRVPQRDRTRFPPNWLDKRHPPAHQFGTEEDLIPLFCLEKCNRILRFSPSQSDCDGQVAAPEGKITLRRALNACRVIKDEHEISLIKKANEITTKAHLAALKGLHHFSSEPEVDAAYTGTCIAQNAKEQAYAPIVGSGPNAGVLHYGANNEAFGDRQVCVMDAGCEVQCYASDVTRTFPLNKSNPGHWPSIEAKEVYELVEKVQEACIEALGPGRDFIQIAMLARRLTIEGLMKLGILKGEFEDIWLAGTVMGFFPHGLGHHLGLDVHDVSPIPHPPLLDAVAQFRQIPPEPILRLLGPFDFASPALTEECSARPPPSTLEPGMVVTIEPGCYFNKFLLEHFFLNDAIHSQFIDKDVLKRYWKIGGVRIEDDILITRDGYENLTTTPKGEKMLEVIREAARK